MAQKLIMKTEEKIFFLVALGDVAGHIKNYILPGIVGEDECLVIYSNLEELFAGLAEWNLYGKQYGELKYRFYIDERIDGIIEFSNFLITCRDNVVIKPIQPFLDALELLGCIKVKEKTA